MRLSCIFCEKNITEETHYADVCNTCHSKKNPEEFFEYMDNLTVMKCDCGAVAKPSTAMCSACEDRYSDEQQGISDFDRDPGKEFYRY